jgi:VanZ family protein
MLAAFFTRLVKNYKPQALRLHLFLLAVIFGTLYGISDEFHQSFVPGRDVSGFDVFIDFLGSAIGSRVYLWLV